jgi:hypothetical protein
MAVGIVGNGLAYSYKKAGKSCHMTELNIELAFLMYFSYFILFANFFYRAYFKKTTVAKGTERVLSQAQMLAKKAM